MENRDKVTVVVAGASGFVGRALPKVFGGSYELIGLSRDPSRLPTRPDGYRWRKCDLFSRVDALEALEGADCAVYLVHSMRRSARLTQGNFRDMDLICADNFARAAQEHGIKHVVYLSEIVPRTGEVLAEPLLSRLEVEETLASYGTALTTLRTGLVLGAGGSGTELLIKLVERLPVMGLPRWTSSSVAPIDVEDVARLIRYALEHPEWAWQGSGGTSHDRPSDERPSDERPFHDIGGPEVVTYRELLERMARLLGKNRRFIDLPALAPALSTLWISVFGGQPRQVVAPMIESFLYDHEPKNGALQEASGLVPIGVDAALKRAIVGETETMPRPGGDLVTLKKAREVRSVQRLPLPSGVDAMGIASEYARWLPRFMRPVIRVDRDAHETLRFYVRPLPVPILVLALDRESSLPDRQLFWIRGGLLVESSLHARLEFREVLDGRAVIAAIHQFRPRLPWYVYVLTQALVHGLVMSAFGRHLRGLAREKLEEERRPLTRRGAGRG